MEEQKIIVTLDVDGILANFYLAACRRFDLPYNVVTQFYMEGLKWDEIKDDYEFWNTLPTLSPPEAITFDFNKYLTSIPDGMEQARIDWLSKNGYPDVPMTASHNKAAHCKKHGIDVLIDDKPKTIRECKELGVFAIQFIPYYAQMPYETKAIIKHLPEAKPILELIQKYKNIKHLLPEAVQKDLINVYYTEGLVRFDSLVDYCNGLFSNHTVDDIFKNVSRWHTNSLKKYHSWLRDEKVLGKDRYHAVGLLIDEAMGSI